MAVVLIVEDNPDIARLYEVVFKEHETRITDDVPQAIEYLQSQKPDLVIVDFYLPSGSAVDVLAYIRTQQALLDVPVLGVSVDDMLRSEAQRVGMQAFLTKPLDINELVQTARKLISYGTGNLPRTTMSGELKAALNEYATAYQKVYNRQPNGQWTGTQVLIGGHPCDEAWLRAETRRLNSLVANNANPRGYILRLLDKIRRL